MIVLEYVYSLPIDLQVRKSGEAALKERGLAWCHRLVQHVNDWDSDPLISLLTNAMLRIEARQRLSAGLCLKRARELGLFDKPSVSSGGATPTRPTAVASRVRNEGEETPNIIVGPLRDTRGQRSASDHHSALSASCQVGVSSSLDNKAVRSLRKGTYGAVSNRLNGHSHSPLEFACPPEARSMHTRSKRYRSPAVSPYDTSDKGLVKRRTTACLTQVRVLRSSKITSATDDINKVSYP